MWFMRVVCGCGCILMCECVCACECAVCVGVVLVCLFGDRCGVLLCIGLCLWMS